MRVMIMQVVAVRAQAHYASNVVFVHLHTRLCNVDLVLLLLLLAIRVLHNAFLRGGRCGRRRHNYVLDERQIEHSVEKRAHFRRRASVIC